MFLFSLLILPFPSPHPLLSNLHFCRFLFILFFITLVSCLQNDSDCMWFSPKQRYTLFSWHSFPVTDFCRLVSRPTESQIEMTNVITCWRSPFENSISQRRGEGRVGGRKEGGGKVYEKAPDVRGIDSQNRPRAGFRCKISIAFFAERTWFLSEEETRGQHFQHFSDNSLGNLEKGKYGIRDLPKQAPFCILYLRNLGM